MKSKISSAKLHGTRCCRGTGVSELQRPGVELWIFQHLELVEGIAVMGGVAA
jgi:hypothetical protein